MARTPVAHAHGQPMGTSHHTSSHLLEVGVGGGALPPTHRQTPAPIPLPPRYSSGILHQHPLPPQVFTIGKLSGLVPPDVSLEHVPFGLVQGEDGKKFKTRSGETVKLVDLLMEALSRARADVEARLAAEGRQEPEDFVREVARAVGIGAVKYADLAMNRQSNYRF
eukprot:scaffold23453_cov67-Isochrysis_galbana.AAC.1